MSNVEARSGSPLAWASRHVPSPGSCTSATCLTYTNLDPLTGTVIRASKTTAIRYEHDHPGSLAHTDVKKIDRIPDAGDWRPHGRQMGSTTARKKLKLGYDYV